MRMNNNNRWIFLRGLAREGRHWGRFLAEFQQTMPRSQVITLDLPGNGYLNRLRSPLRVDAMVAFCRTELALRHIEPPYQILAMSLGGMVSVAWAQSQPDEIAAQVLINTSMRPFSPFYQRLRPENYLRFLKLLLRRAPPEAWERAILEITSNRSIVDVLPRWLALRHTHPVSDANVLRQLIAAARFCASLQAPIAPTLLLASAQDQLVAVACSQNLAQRWACELRLHPRAGHDLTLDDGPWVANQVRDWLANITHTKLSENDTP
jgi:pimeloyl-ACP methyl ester carboxylesterase